MAQFKMHSKVVWKWLGKTISGVVEEVFFKSVTKTIKGKKITRHGSKEKPAYLVKSEAGNLALKLETELLTPTKAKQSTKTTPQIFK
ncbi:MAG: DUF2945 domain-containing protein [Bdellovibrionota bacterium]